jgi:hypothetical protein
MSGLENNIYFNQTDLSRRWKLSVRTLEQWRFLGKGPRYTKIGNCVRYLIDDIEDYEKNHIFNNTAQY